MSEGAPILEHVTHSGRTAQIVLQHSQRSVVVAHEVDPGHVDAHPVRRHDAVHGSVEVFGTGDE